jgi:cytochrome c5
MAGEEKMKHAFWFVLLAACCLAIAVAQGAQGAGQAQPAAQSQPAKNAAASPQGAPQNRGELKFEQNCSRCHNAPQELSTRITGTVVLHMRARASLSDADAKAILQYLAP